MCVHARDGVVCFGVGDMTIVLSDSVRDVRRLLLHPFGWWHFLLVFMSLRVVVGGGLIGRVFM